MGPLHVLPFSAFCIVLVLIVSVLHIYLVKKSSLHLFPIIVAPLLSIVLIVGWFTLSSTEIKVRNHYKSLLQGFAPTYARMMEEFGHNSLNIMTPPSNPKYLFLIELEKKWLSSNPYVRDIYTMIKTPEGKLAFLVDSETDYNHDGKFEGEREQRTSIGEVYNEATPAMFKAFDGVPSFDIEPVSDRWGTWISAYEPIQNKDGTVAAVVGVDYPADEIMTDIKSAANSVMLNLGYNSLVILISVFSACLVYSQLLNRKKLEAIKEIAEAQLAEQQSRSIESERLAALGTMAAGIAHEINNPLAIVSGKLFVLKKILSSPQLNLDQANATFDILFKTMDRISQIIRAMKTLVRQSNNDPLTDINLSQLINDTMQICLQRFKNQNVDIQIEKSTESIFVLGREGQISQVLLNLLNNAVDAIQDQPQKWIKIKLHSLGDTVELHVVDSGHGVSSEIFGKLWTPFMTTKPVGQGTGLGLPLSRQMMQSMNGHLDYLVVDGHTCFRMTFQKASTSSVKRAA